VLVVHKTTLEQETRDLDHHVICQCRKYRQLVCQVGGFAACFPPNILMVYSSTLAVTTDGGCLMCSGFSLGENIHFGCLEFIIGWFGGSGAIFVGTIHSGSPSLWAMIEGSPDEFLMASSGEGSSDLPFPRRLHTGASPAPTATARWLEDAPATQTMMMVPAWAPHRGWTPGPPLGDSTPFRWGNKRELTLNRRTLSMRQHNDEASSPASKQSP
jgi:hypothetical protein